MFQRADRPAVGQHMEGQARDLHHAVLQQRRVARVEQQVAQAALLAEVHLLGEVVRRLAGIDQQHLAAAHLRQLTGQRQRAGGGAGAGVGGGQEQNAQIEIQHGRSQIRFAGAGDAQAFIG